jgi:hypothetical protein
MWDYVAYNVHWTSDKYVENLGLKTGKNILPYFSIDNTHLMYNAHPKLFDIPFDV